MATALTKKEMEKNMKTVVENTMNLLESLHIVHKDDPIEKILDTKLPIGNDLTLGGLLINLYQILEPLLELARKQYPLLFGVIDWLEDVVSKLLASE